MINSRNLIYTNILDLTFESAPVFNSTALHGLNVGDTIYVYVDPNNYSHYYVEV